MNVHHLELFYYVARHGGISEAVRNIPYGIQQPAISGQILQLEDHLGVTLFTRRRFTLTPAGQELYEFIKPFFSRIDEVAEKVSGGATQLVRMAASSIVLKDHLPNLLRNVRKKFPRLKLVLHSGLQSDVMTALERHEIDLAVTVVEGKLPADVRGERLLELPLILLVQNKSRVRSASELWTRDRIEEGLVGLPPREALSKQFQAGLARLGVEWPVSIEVNSLDLIETYVAGGFGFGISVAAPGRKSAPSLRALPLPEFPALVLGISWRGKLSALHREVVDECARRARELGVSVTSC
jgi:DNA-binding transcriptional LysR family regulator